MLIVFSYREDNFSVACFVRHTLTCLKADDRPMYRHVTLCHQRVLTRHKKTFAWWQDTSPSGSLKLSDIGYCVLSTNLFRHNWYPVTWPWGTARRTSCLAAWLLGTLYVLIPQLRRYVPRAHRNDKRKQNVLAHSLYLRVQFSRANSTVLQVRR